MGARTQTFLLFFCFATLGTMLHECGHALAAIFMGCKATIHYGFTNYYCQSDNEARSLITGLAGPLINILIGSIGFALLCRNYKKRVYKNEILFSAISFFWCREIVVLVADIFIKPIWYPTAFPSDEQRASVRLFQHPLVFPLLFGTIALLICGTVVFCFLSKEKRLPFIIWGIAGSFVGYLFWFRFLGPVLLP